MEVSATRILDASGNRPRWAAAVGLTAAYAVLAPPLHAVIENNAGILAMLPVVVSSALLGVRAGTGSAFALAGFLVVMVLLRGDSLAGWAADGGVLGSTALLATGVTVGSLRDMHLRATRATGLLQAEVETRNLLENTVVRMQRMESLGRMAGGVAHDFNNLLTPILGYSELALLRLPENAEQLRPLLSEVHRSAEHASKLAEQLLVFSRHDFAEPTLVNLSNLLLDSEPVLRSLLRKDTELAIIPSEGEAFVMADERQLRQVLINLVLNARDAMPKGGRLILQTLFGPTPSSSSHHVPALLPAETVGFSVADSGAGMDVATLEHVFEPFFTTKPQGQGTGLGLSSCFGIVSQAGGGIWIDSTLHVGTTITVALPRVHAEGEPVPHDDEEESALAEGKETVPVVDDEPAVRQFTAGLLRDVGYQVIEAENGEDALRVVDRKSLERIDLLLTDMVMPLMGGHELVERFSTMHPETKVLCISGYTDEESAYPAVRALGAEFLRKPFTASALTSKTRQVLSLAA